MQNENPMKKFQFFIMAGLAVIFFAIIVSNSTIITIQPGQKGVIFRPLSANGLDKENIYSAGLQVIAPWNTMYIFDVTEQNLDAKVDILDKNALSINIDVSIRFFPNHDGIGTLQEKFQQNYINALVVPEMRSSVRQVMGKFTAEEIFSSKRKEITDQIISQTRNKLQENNIEMANLLIRSITLPEKLKKAIESKLTQEQEALAYRFKLDKEKSEAERRRIEAEGEAQANQIINSSLTPSLLKMRGIEATLELAKSPNSKVVVVGSGKDGLPLILGDN